MNADIAEPLPVEPGASAEDEPSGWRPNFGDLWPYIVALALFAVVARTTLGAWWYAYTRPESFYNHALLIPALSLLMLWRKRECLRGLKPSPSFGALVILALVCLLQIDAAQREIQIVMSWSLIFMIWSAVWFVGGAEFIRVAKYPLLFLALMVPLPGPWLNDSTHGLQQLSTGGASWLLAHTGFDNVRSGYEIKLSDYTLFVDVPCSGFKTLLALLTFDVFFAYMLNGSVLKRSAIFAVSIPLAVAVNVVRIVLIALVGQCVSDDAARSFHDYSGLITLVIGFAFLFGLARLFGCRKFAGLDIF
ncbi:MAG: exosortase/archaeosortase family protein [Capsulimonadaceae bacterium]|nr:exosortase/archaeosortase family protein [Capsulimonadaceae bacterium]